MADHPYLVKKGVQAHGIRLLGDALVIPFRDAAGRLCSLQFISPEGEKRFLSGGRKRGRYFAMGQPDGALCICEGYATGASVREATGHAVAVAFDAGNLAPVARALRAKFPRVKLILCGDADPVGVSRATAAARAVRGYLAVPNFEGVAACPD
jgi:putative DNA primase/helicase